MSLPRKIGKLFKKGKDKEKKFPGQVSTDNTVDPTVNQQGTSRRITHPAKGKALNWGIDVFKLLRSISEASEVLAPMKAVSAVLISALETMRVRVTFLKNQ